MLISFADPTITFPNCQSERKNCQKPPLLLLAGYIKAIAAFLHTGGRQKQVN
jgi:hypothetical protein